MLESFIERMLKYPTPQVILEIHGYINRTITYEIDDGNDHWQTLRETLDRRAGDCEDFVIAKYYLALRAGIPDDDLLLVTCYTEPPHDQTHMVLVHQGVIYDNRTLQPMLCEYSPYVPLFGFNGTKRILVTEDWKEGESFENHEKWEELQRRAENLK